ncbi:glutamine-dependent NAD(+) synthetase, putative [Plasmodium berghei]|uniref:Glutamine-dependent NAD(+) synthetase, putative n=2 Tax=Plasmodium berghei TaxID=5821 RepID=A0A509AP13_PLABA|nr:glutamine-dependent NAD(+) synthetase, putative [Plasmodium berghei ANKA]CXI35247.1 glutamine-dependent NAD(+) synthetase, putative [Plasmodium berghei]SCM21491.1 glutamine-dependent NAD(+) synthetase, putative [Plasmodium berghei]SCN24692.1 glutamine-dependent NAD(+) synthetase, putative [Plasmodium berghei]SCO59840.1 glutamine-dependent NAD(+) synthetase, putative [Plasmodium berghei]SCO61135.1 glutamine-dependent NAD(+) synthetase, putative [Plasmodium berghei]|eukprot:XP_034421247.1 glutamine-dependent NAD(+) synthetase, putative [Plasmodium berghei ANKA]
MKNSIGLSCCSIYSNPLDYEGNKLKIIESIKQCKSLNCSIRIGGELEITGVSCKNSFKGIEDIHENCWLTLSNILKEKYEGSNITDNILCFISMPIYFKKKLYSSEVIIYNSQIIYISPKENVENNEQSMYFSPYVGLKCEEDIELKNEGKNTIIFSNSNVNIISNHFEIFSLPKCIQNVTQQKETYIGKCIIEYEGVAIAHTFLDDLISIERNEIIDDRIDIFNKWDPDCNHSINYNVSENKKNISPFEKEYIKLTTTNKINLECIDVLLVNGYITNELELFKKYFSTLMNLTKKYPHLILCFSNNFGCDNYLYMFDGFSFIGKNEQILTKNGRYSFYEIQVASVKVEIENKQEDIKKEINSKICKNKIGKQISLLSINKHGKDTKEPIFAYNKDIPLSIECSKDTLSKNLPDIFNINKYSKDNKNLAELFSSHHCGNRQNNSEPSTESSTESNTEYSTTSNTESRSYYIFNGQVERLHNIYEELSFNCSMFLWHILHLSKAKGFTLALSGGIDSAFCACMVYVLATMLEIQMKEIEELNEIEDNNKHEQKGIQSDDINKKLFLNKLKNILINKACKKNICNKLLNTLSMPSKNNSQETKYFCEELSKAINSYHNIYNIDDIYMFFKNIGEKFLNEKLKFKTENGTNYHDLCLQNIQSRSRMIMLYFFNTLICQKKYAQYNMYNEFLITLATGNLDESIMGYFTKYDCSSGDIDIIGNVSKILIKETMCYIANSPVFDLQILNKINSYFPSAELKPLENKQNDENELNLKFVEIKLLTILKNKFSLGPSSMYYYLSQYFWPNMSKSDIFDKIQIFFTKIYKNIHKLFILPPSLQNESCAINMNNFSNFATMDFDKIKQRYDIPLDSNTNASKLTK